MRDEGFEQFFRGRYLKACRFACAVVGEADAEDAVQEAFTRLYVRRGALGEIENRDAYFFRILYHVCINMVKRRGFWKKIRHLFRPSGKLREEADPADRRQVWSELSPTEKAVESTDFTCAV